MLDTRIEEGLRGMAEEEQQRMRDTDAKGINGRLFAIPGCCLGPWSKTVRPLSVPLSRPIVPFRTIYRHVHD
jgi:hypothetical protein